MTSVGGALGDPLLEQGDLFWGEWLAVFERWHEVVLVLGGDTMDELALFGQTGSDGDLTGLGGMRGALAGIKAEIGFAGGFVKAVAAEAMFREDGADFEIEIEGGCDRASDY